MNNYTRLLTPVKLQVIRKSLNILSKSSHFTSNIEIIFFTNFKGVVIPQHLKKSYPERILIVLQHQFYNLQISEDKFNVTLSFHGNQEQITVPFLSIIRFYDKISEDILTFPEHIEGDLPHSSIISIDQLRDK